MNYDDALSFLTSFARKPPGGDINNYGYDLYLPQVMFNYLSVHEGAREWSAATSRMQEISPLFFTAAWDLCRRGVLRPSVRRWNDQSTPDGCGFSVTPFGRTWLDASATSEFVPTEPARFAAMLKPLAVRLGSAFFARGQEAVQCYHMQCHMACCAMCGAAAESILLALACRVQPEDDVLRVYGSAQGRSRVEKMVTAPPNAWTARDLAGFTVLLKYWRDESAHGLDVQLGDDEAFIALALLLRFALWADRSIDKLASQQTN